MYLIAGNYKNAREVIYQLRQAISAPDPFAPFGYVDRPTAANELKGVVDVSGWAVDNVAVSKVELLVDGNFVGTARYGLPRHDVSREYPNAPSLVGFKYELNTAAYPNGRHLLQVKVFDTSKNVALFPPIDVVVSN